MSSQSNNYAWPQLHVHVHRDVYKTTPEEDTSFNHDTKHGPGLHR